MQMSKNRLQNTQWFEAQQIDIHNRFAHRLYYFDIVIQYCVRIDACCWGTVSYCPTLNLHWILSCLCILYSHDTAIPF